MNWVTATELIERPKNYRPHVLLLGAGASCAAFPNGDASGRRLPVMNNFVDVVGCAEIINDHAPELSGETNIEVVYPRLLERAAWESAAREIEARIRAYFSAMSLPDEATLYDRLVLALRPQDSIFTFNWDPFLADAWQRNRGVVPLPSIHYLHGSVRGRMCPQHSEDVTQSDGLCPRCGVALEATPLLYPVEQKDYQSHPAIKASWDAAETKIADSLTLTVFGYGAPVSDVGAVELLRNAWFARSERAVEHLELIDICDRETLEHRWKPFLPTFHGHPVSLFAESHIARWPRRVSESWAIPMIKGLPCDSIDLPATDNLRELQDYCREIAQHER